MINIRLAKAAAFAAVLFVSASCMDNDVDLVGYGDAYILTEVVDGDTLKGLGLHAYSYSDMATVRANLKDVTNPVYDLTPYLGYAQDFTWSTPLSQFSSSIPTIGEYIFNATFKNGEVLTFSNRLTNSYILPPEIESCTFLLTSDRIDIDWKSVAKADSYNIKLLDDEGKILFVSPLYNNTINTYSFGMTTQGWMPGSAPSDGDTVTVELAAYLMEKNTSEGDLQAISKSRVTLTWGM